MAGKGYAERGKGGYIEKRSLSVKQSFTRDRPSRNEQVWNSRVERTELERTRVWSQREKKGFSMGQRHRQAAPPRFRHAFVLGRVPGALASERQEQQVRACFFAPELTLQRKISVAECGSIISQAAKMRAQSTQADHCPRGGGREAFSSAQRWSESDFGVDRAATHGSRVA